MAKLTPTEARQLKDSYAAKTRLNMTLRQGDNRYGEYGRNCRASLARHDATIARLEAKKAQP